MPSTEPQRCDFCSGETRPFTVFGCEDFRLAVVARGSDLYAYDPDADAGPVVMYGSDFSVAEGVFDPSDMGPPARVHNFRGDWLACSACAPLVSAPDWPKLRARLRSGSPSWLLAPGLWAMFADHASGKSWPA
jgi:hypothetical protein